MPSAVHAFGGWLRSGGVPHPAELFFMPHILEVRDAHDASMGRIDPLADCPYEDLTTVGLGIEETCGTVSASLKAPGIAAGIDLAREIFLAAGASVEVFAKDGDSLAARVPFLCARGSSSAPCCL